MRPMWHVPAIQAQPQPRAPWPQGCLPPRLTWRSGPTCAARRAPPPPASAPPPFPASPAQRTHPGNRHHASNALFWAHGHASSTAESCDACLDEVPGSAVTAAAFRLFMTIAEPAPNAHQGGHIPNAALLWAFGDGANIPACACCADLAVQLPIRARPCWTCATRILLSRCTGGLSGAPWPGGRAGRRPRRACCPPPRTPASRCPPPRRCAPAPTPAPPTPDQDPGGTASGVSRMI